MVSHRSRPVLFFLLALLAAAILAVVQSGLIGVRADTVSPVAGAQWIWAPGPIDEGAPIAFYALAEVELEAVPADAELLIAADEDYRLHVNGHWVGGGRYSDTQGPDLYPLGAVLRTGTNRIVVELRSSRGAGGLLAGLVSDGRERPLLVTDETWRIARHYDEALLQPASEGADGTLAALPDSLELEPVEVWGPPPTGRWRIAREPASCRPWFNASEPFRLTPPGRGRGIIPGQRWQRLRRRHDLLPPELRTIRTHFSWRRPIDGVLVLDLSNTEADVALVRVADKLDDFSDSEMESHYMLMIPIPGSTLWRAPEPARFQYLEVYGVALERRPFVVEVEPGVEVMAASQLASQDQGVMGIDPLWMPSRAIRTAIARIQEAELEALR